MCLGLGEIKEMVVIKRKLLAVARVPKLALCSRWCTISKDYLRPDMGFFSLNVYYVTP